MKILNRLKGINGENTAETYLKKSGYKIIEKNYKTKIAEIDIIAIKDNILTFVEVKLRTSDTFGMPYEAVNNAKINKIRKNAEIYIYSNENIYYEGISFDIIEILLNDNKINHLKSVF